MNTRITTIRVVSWVLTFLAVAVPCTSAYQNRVGSANVNVAVVDPFGVPVEHFEVDLFDVKRALVSSHIGTETFKNVLFGDYYVVARTGCCRAERFISINTASLFLRIAVPVRFGDSDLPGGSLSVEGVVLPKSRWAKDMWVRVRGVFLDSSREERLDSNGHYSIRGLDMGSYTCELFNGSSKLFSQRLELDPKRPIVRVLINLDRDEKN
jgi:hypothetical protein